MSESERIFQMCHGTLDMSKLIRLSDVMDSEEETRELFGLSPSEIQDSLEYLNVEADTIYRNKENFIHPIHYISGFHMVDIHSLNIDIMRMLMTKDSIECWDGRFKKWEREGNWNSLIAFSDKRIALHRFLEHYKEIPEDQIVDIFSEMYMRQEFGLSMIDDEVIDYVYQHSHKSDDWRRRMLKIERHKVKVYRGTKEGHEAGYSWTTSRKTAEYFANRFDKNGIILEGMASKSDILDYIDKRGESEILINPNKVAY